MDKDITSVNPEDGSPQDTRLDSNGIISTEKGPFLRQVGNRIEKRRYSFIKVIKYGAYVEVIEAEYPFLLGRTTTARRTKDPTSLKRTEEYRRRNVKRAKDKLRRLFLNNFNDKSKLITLTFDNKCDFDITNISECNKKFSIFMRLLRRLYSDFKYIGILEFQERGAVHYHIACDLPYIDKRRISTFWGLGYLDIRQIGSTYGTIFYLLKYVIKSLYDERYRGKRIYFTSNNLRKTQDCYNERAYAIKNELLRNGVKPTFSYVENSPEHGRITVTEYNLDNYEGKPTHGLLC